MDKNDKMMDFNPYEAEARLQWGDQAVDETTQVIKKHPDQFQKDFNEIYQHLASIRHLPTDSQEAQEAIGLWYQFLNKLGDYSPEAFRGLGKLYTEDSRFTQNIDQYGQGLAYFMKEAMEVYADRLLDKN